MRFSFNSTIFFLLLTGLSLSTIESQKSSKQRNPPSFIPPSLPPPPPSPVQISQGSFKIPSAEILTVEENFSPYQGIMTFEESTNRCAELNMRLPTSDEIINVQLRGFKTHWEDNGNFYMTEDGPPYLLTNTTYKGPKKTGHVRCHKDTYDHLSKPFGEWSVIHLPTSWPNAQAKCESLGMRLPTLEELYIAFLTEKTMTWRKHAYSLWSADVSNPKNYHQTLSITKGDQSSQSNTCGTKFICIEKSGIRDISMGRGSKKELWTKLMKRDTFEKAKSHCEKLKKRLPTLEEISHAHAAGHYKEWVAEEKYEVFSVTYWTLDPHGPTHQYVLQGIGHRSNADKKAHTAFYRCINK